MRILRVMFFGLMMLGTRLALSAEPGLLKPVGGVGTGEAKDGLRVTLKPVKDEFGPGESLLMQAIISNVGDTEKTLTVVKNRLNGAFDFRLELRRAGKTLELTPRAEKDNPARAERTLASGGKLEFWIDLRSMAEHEGGPFSELGGYEAAVVFVPTGARSGWAVFNIAEAGRPTPKPRDAAEAEKIRSLIQALGDDDFQKRENAEAELVTIGERALGLLKSTLETSKDAEIKLRCKRIIVKIEAALKDRQHTRGFCAECLGKAFTADVGQCSNCHGTTASGSFTYCSACAVRLGLCAACGKNLGQPEPRPMPNPIERPVRPRRPIVQPLAPAPAPAPGPEDDF